ncbi:R3H domain-containing nucleic acid-binding protein [Synechococcus sp. PCC 7336]|uniref:R3H domain-containing nucleic acid-binding protein n=1 Tax=Synechococcus sp. PCC 7336 TaxID=195250 RepID=UPI0003469447|nr:R3H domain-containing nucleic acid-binding protein [Synechococcus sp. PCC 7336]
MTLQNHPPDTSSPAPLAAWPNQQDVTDDLDALLDILPQPLREALIDRPNKAELVEVVLDLGRLPEARFPGSAEYLTQTPIQRAELDYCIQRVGEFSEDNRAGIESTLHRISAIRNRQGTIIGLTCRVGRSVMGTIDLIQDLVEQGRSILLLGRPGVGKTTALREIARVLADDFEKRVVIIDTSNEIAGDGDVPHPAIGRARRMQVARPSEQHRVMIEAVENHMPEVVIIDEIGTELEALAARTIAERGVQLVGTAHGNQIANLIKNPTLSDLIGGIQSVTLGDDEARRRGSQKSVLERKAPPTFEIAVEMLERTRWIVHAEVAETVDNLLRRRDVTAEVRTLDDNGQIVRESTTTPAPKREVPRGRRDRNLPMYDSPMYGSGRGGWQRSGRMAPLPLEVIPHPGAPSPDSWMNVVPVAEEDGGLSGTTVYPYGVSRFHLEQAIQTLHLPVRITKDIDTADLVLALRSHVRNRSKIQQLAKARSIPIHTLKANTLPQITRALRRILQIDEPPSSPETDLDAFMFGDSEDEMEALEEARLAVEQIVIPKAQPVELLPRSASIRRMQHELVEHYHLSSKSFGEEPNRRIRIYPA